MIYYGFQIFNVLFFLFQTLRGVSLLPINPVVAFFLFILWNTLKFKVSKGYKIWIVYLAISFLTIFLFSECLKVFSATGNTFIAECVHYSVFSLAIFSIITLLSLILLLFYFVTLSKKGNSQENSQMMWYVASFIYLDSFFIRASKDEFSFLIAMLVTLFIIFKHVNELKSNLILVAIILFSFTSLMIDFFAIYKPEVLIGKINFISITEYIFIELISFLVLWRYKDSLWRSQLK